MPGRFAPEDDALAVDWRLERNLLDLQQELLDHSYAPSRSVCFVTRRPKLREIFAADFRDRVVHHVLVDHLEPIWERIFIHDSWACRKGIHAAVARLQQFQRRASVNGTCAAWYLQLDIRNYFMSIDKARLFALLAPRIADDDARWLTERPVFHDCTANYQVKGGRARWPGCRRTRACSDVGRARGCRLAT